MASSWRELCFLGIRPAGELFRSRRLSPVELVQAHLDAIDAVDGRLKSYVRPLPERAMAQARTAEAEMLRGEYRGPLHGIPYGLKDLFDTAGIPTEAHSKVLEGRTPASDATAVANMNRAGAVLLGKQAMGEFAVGNLKTALYDRPRNPWNHDYDTGGSSSGSAAAVAAGLCMTALGTDTGGSIRGPASHCGAVGLKPTYGRVSRRGVIPLSWSLDHCGPLARSVEDAALTLGAAAGPAGATAPAADFIAGLGRGVAGVRIGVPRSFYTIPDAGAAPEVLEAVDAALVRLEGLGARVEEITVPALGYFRAAHTVIMLSEAYNIHRRNLVSKAMDYGPVTWHHLATGAMFSAADYAQAQRIRQRLVREFTEVMKRVDVVAMPTAPKTAWPVDQGDRVGPLEPFSFRACFNMTGMPAITVPCGFDGLGLPMGLQLAARPYDESTLFCVAHAYETAAGWTARRPPV